MITSKELSLKFKEAGFEKESEFICVRSRSFPPHIIHKSEKKMDDRKLYNSYDILNDLCVKYAKEVFGEASYKCDKCGDFTIQVGLLYCEKCDGCYITINRGFKEYSEKIFKMLQQNKSQKEVEDYIVANSILFK